MNEHPVLTVVPIDFHWPTLDPFLFCAHHNDAYPPGNDRLAPDPALLKGRDIGMDFQVRDGWRMYHGDVVPGFPRHPHRGFETITLARSGFIDHADSLGATARFGQGDVQWMTAGQGIVHAEMFPLVNSEGPNPTELFQIWLNLPAASKFVDAYFTMLWRTAIPRESFPDDDGKRTEVTMIAGALDGHDAPKAPPSSWAARAESDVAVWLLRMEPGARWTLPPAAPDSNRVLYFFAGDSLEIAGSRIAAGHAAQVQPGAALELRNGSAEGEVLMLQGRPIGEPVVQHGPFVMNSPEEIQQAMRDYQATGFGGWPWPTDGPVHPRERGRFAIHADGREEQAH